MNQQELLERQDAQDVQVATNENLLVGDEKDKDTESYVFEGLIDCLKVTNCLQFGDFTLKSGIKAPYFFNAGNINHGASLRLFAKAYAEKIINIIDTTHKIDVLFGPSYKGIPIAAAVTVALHEMYGVNLPYIYNRKEKKTHGEGGVIVGMDTLDTTTKNVLVIDDVITRGTALRESLTLITNTTNFTVVGVVVMLDRCENAEEGSPYSSKQALEKELGFPIYPILDVRNLLDAADAQNRERLAKYIYWNCVV